MRQFLHDVLTEVQASSRFEDSREALFRALSALGFERSLYISGNRDPHTRRPYIEQTRFWSFPEREFDDYYFSNGLHRKDPALRYALETRGPFHWGSPHYLASLDEEERRVNDVPKAFGYMDGWSMPVLSPDPYHMGGLTVLHDRGNDSAFTARLREHETTLVLLVHWFHATVSLRFGAELIRHQAAVLNGSAPLLTARERECLQWVAAGLASKEVAERLRIAERTVNLHLGNAMRKLGVRSRVQAVARALALGMIEP